MDKKIENTSFEKNHKRWLAAIILSGLLFRILFLMFGGKFYFGTENFQIQGDTYGWLDSILNLINHGIYTSDLEVKNGAFFRPPGFAFLIGIFYFLCGSDVNSGLQMLSWTQIGLDTLAIWMVFKITFSISRNYNTSLIAAALYAIYPFIIVWTPVLYAEATSVFFLITSIFFLTKQNTSGKNSIISGLFAGMAVLTRLQCIFIVPALVLYLYKSKTGRFNLKSRMLPFLVSFGLLYGSWPLRNLVFHDRLLFSQDLRVGKHWSPDYMAFMEYIFAVQTDHQPQYKQLTENLVVEWPAASYKIPEDSALLAKTTELFKTCGTGLSHFKFHAGLIKAPVAPDKNCDATIEKNFLKLKESQIKNNAVHYYLLVPLSNLKKSIFKFSLYGDKGFLVKLAGSSLFLYRTFFILLGLLAIILNYKKKWFDPAFGTMAITYFCIWYFFLCFVYRNIEIRYLLHCDILLLIPSAAFIGSLFKKKYNQN